MPFQEHSVQLRITWNPEDETAEAFIQLLLIYLELFAEGYAYTGEHHSTTMGPPGQMLLLITEQGENLPGLGDWVAEQITWLESKPELLGQWVEKWRQYQTLAGQLTLDRENGVVFRLCDQEAINLWPLWEEQIDGLLGLARQYNRSALTVTEAS